MKRDEFREVLFRQYSNVINHLIFECEKLSILHSTYCELDLKIRELVLFAKSDGLDESIVWEIVQMKLPDYFEKTKTCPIAA